MGNQQERLSWLAGFIDGDGTISYGRYLTDRIRPGIGITNTHIKTLPVVTALLDEVGIAYYVKWGEYKTGDQQLRSVWRLGVNGTKRVHRLLALILPYLVTKQEQGLLLYEYCKSRLAVPRGGNPKQMSSRAYSEHEISLIQQLKTARVNPQRLYAGPNPKHHKNSDRPDDNGYAPFKQRCLICGREFDGKRSRPDRKCCSTRCKAIYQTKHEVGEDIVRSSGKPEEARGNDGSPL